MALRQQTPSNTKGASAVLSRDPRKAMQEIMDIIDSLRLVMDAETAALKETDTGTFIRLQDDKIAAARKYQEGVTQMLARKEEMKGAPQALKDMLAQKREEFSQTADSNLDAIARMRKGMERLSNRIMQTAKREAEDARKFAYGAHGKLEGSGKASLGINERA